MRSAKARLAVEGVLAACAVILCVTDVRWELRPGLFPILDEVSTHAVMMHGTYAQVLNIFPHFYYADRPLGWLFIRLMADIFNFDYYRQATCLVALHFANCGLAFWLYRKLGVGIPLSIAGVGLFGSLWTSAQTATYLGEAFDVVCLFFLLGSTLALLSEWRGSSILSALLFFAALRSKEFAIVTPFVFTVLVWLRLPRMKLAPSLAAIARRLWLHYLILIVIGLRYAYLYRYYRVLLKPGNPYLMDLHVSTVIQSLSYYTGLIFGQDGSSWHIPPAILALGFGVVLGWAILRRMAGIAFGITAYVMTALPVFLMPHIRAPYWAYAPQVFLILALCLLAEEFLVKPWKREQVRWIAAVSVAIVSLAWCVAFRRSDYFKDRINWCLMVRRASARTALDAAAQLPPMGPGTHVYVDHPAGTPPWLFVAGPCSYLQIVNRQEDITCVVDQPAAELRALYEKDPGPKYFVDYHEDGSITSVPKPSAPH